MDKEQIARVLAVEFYVNESWRGNDAYLQGVLAWFNPAEDSNHLHGLVLPKLTPEQWERLHRKLWRGWHETLDGAGAVSYTQWLLTLKPEVLARLVVTAVQGGG